MNYEDFKRDLAVRILRKIDEVIRDDSSVANDLLVAMMEALDEFLPKDESDKRGPTEFTDLVCVYEVDCPDCDASPEYTDVHPFCPECGYSFN
jgi:hypothetical protein